MNLLNILPGKKTYLVGLAMVASGLLSAFLPEVAATLNIVVDDPGTVVMEGLGFIFMRRGIGS